MDDELYRDLIVDHYQHPHHYGQLEHATHTAQGANLSCGDELTIWAEIADNTIQDLGFEARACAICTASTSLLLDELVGQPIGLIQEQDTQKTTDRLGIHLSPIRLKCALLPVETLKNLEPKR